MRVEGVLFGWIETGLEGTVWALQADNDPGYDGLFVLDEGDHLVIISPAKEVCIGLIFRQLLMKFPMMRQLLKSLRQIKEQMQQHTLVDRQEQIS